MSLKHIHSMGIPTKNYATIENATKALEKFTSTNPDETYRYMISAVNVNGTVRFLPVVILNKDQQWMAGGFAHNSITVTF